MYNYGAQPAALTLNDAEDYKVFFEKKGDDDSNNQPNWFDYWGDDGAVPGLDDSGVDYDAATSSFGYFIGSTVFMGSIAADSDGSLNVPATSDCPGGMFPGAEGIDLTAITLAHESKHKETAALGGTDTDGDGVPDSAEAGTSASNPDSCSLATVIDPDYATYGDDEFIARLAELGVTGIDNSDWALPGRQATVTASPAQNPSSSDSGLVHTPLAAVSTHQAAVVDGPQGVPGGTLTGVYNATGQDTDADTLFNALLLDVEVDAVVADHYSVVAWLADDLGQELVWARTDVELTVGASRVQLVFDGAALNRTGVSQPFAVSRVELFQRVGKHNVMKDSATDVLITAYNSADFDPPAATLVGVVSEQPVDEGADGLYDRLDFTVDLTANDPGDFEVSAQLVGPSFTLLDTQMVSSAGGSVNEQVVLSFSGKNLFYHRQDGPFQLVRLRLAPVPADEQLDFQANAWTTAAYAFTEFQQTGIIIDETSYTDAAGPLDGNGKFSTLDVMLDISSTEPGPYLVHARLEDTEGRTIARIAQNVGLGGVEGGAEVAMLLLSFDGNEISASGVNGPYQLAGVTVFSDAGIVVDQNPTPHLTGPYNATDFSGASDVIFFDGFE